VLLTASEKDLSLNPIRAAVDQATSSVLYSVAIRWRF